MRSAWILRRALGGGAAAPHDGKDDARYVAADVGVCAPWEDGADALADPVGVAADVTSDVTGDTLVDTLSATFDVTSDAPGASPADTPAGAGQTLTV